MTTATAIAAEPVATFADWGIRAFTTTREAGTFGTHGEEAVGVVMGRWERLREELAPFGTRLATARQVHGNRVLTHQWGWNGWLRAEAADGHAALERGTALAVSIADCVPVFIGHPSGAVALLHSGWRGTTTRIVIEGIEALRHAGLSPADLRIHLGPAICGDCYEVSPDVYEQLRGEPVRAPATVDLRALIAGHARTHGVKEIDISAWCTRCHNSRFFSHRAGDTGRQLGVIVGEP